MNELLRPNHPSYKCDKASFVFGMAHPNGLGFCRLAVVEAKTRLEVHVIERLVAVDGTVSPTCQIMTIHRGSDGVGVRSKLVSELPFLNFINDLVDPKRIDGLTQVSIRWILSGGRPTVPEFTKTPLPPKPENNIRADILAALTGLGYSKDQATRMVDSVGDFGSRSIEDILSKCLQKST